MKKTFALPAGTRIQITDVKPGRKKKGSAKVPSMYVRFRLDASNDVLAMFDTQLKSALYSKAGAAAQSAQATLEGVEPITDMPNKRFPDLGALTWPGLSIEDYHLQIPDHGIDIDELTLDDFKAELVEGGSTILRWRALKLDVTKAEGGAVNILYGRDVTGSLMPVAQPEQGSVIGDIAPLGSAETLLKFRQPPAPATKPGDSPGKKAAATKAAKKEAADANKQAELLKAKRVQYMNPETKETWSGKGLQPAWVKLWLKSGRALSLLEVEPGAAEIARSDTATGAFVDAHANGNGKAQVSDDAAWPFPKGANGSTPPPQDVTTEGQTPAQVKKLTAAKAAKTRATKSAAKKGARK